ncbi:YaaA family protein [Alkaliphilus transvaalensis]|uniref:YaaA family protein n=1 Tax=Alkaliphilus transvaalensis TaxID=114628 RepID=UPI00047C2FF2|nr:YaaA family protein [Alkaliphilus transvaalensis]
MKIIISPSKTQNFSNSFNNKEANKPTFINESHRLIEEILKFTIEDLGRIMSLKEPLLTLTYESYRHFHKAKENHCIASYTGMVFKEIQLDDYDEEEVEFMKNHLRILSALYGLLKPLDGIKPYRLDMKMKVIEGGLYQFWQDKITEELKKEDLIINLASGEFSKMVKLPMVTIDFKEKQSNNTYKVVASYAKKARGKMVNYLIKNKITSIENLIGYQLDGYQYNPKLSKSDLIIFSR